MNAYEKPEITFEPKNSPDFRFTCARLEALLDRSALLPGSFPYPKSDNVRVGFLIEVGRPGCGVVVYDRPGQIVKRRGSREEDIRCKIHFRSVGSKIVRFAPIIIGLQQLHARIRTATGQRAVTYWRLPDTTPSLALLCVDPVLVEFLLK